MLHTLNKFVLVSIGSTILFIQTPTNTYGADDLATSDSVTVNYLELNGLFLDSDENSMFGVTIDVYRDSQLYMSSRSKHTGKITTRLPLDYQYTVVFSKPGYVSKKIIVNAQVPFSKRKDYKFLYTIYLFENIAGLDVCAFEDPVAFITFNGLYHFEHDRKYTVFVNKSVEKQYQSYYVASARTKGKSLKKVKKTF